MEPNTIRRLLETSARYLGLDSLTRDAVGKDETSPAADDGADDEAASARVPLACLLSARGCVRPQAMA